MRQFLAVFEVRFGKHSITIRKAHMCASAVYVGPADEHGYPMEHPNPNPDPKLT